MKLKLMPALVGAGLTVVAASASAQGTSEIEALRGELNALQAKIEQLEREQKAQAE